MFNVRVIIYKCFKFLLLRVETTFLRDLKSYYKRELIDCDNQNFLLNISYLEIFRNLL